MSKGSYNSRRRVSANARYTPRISIEALRQRWASRDENDPHINATGRVLVRAAKAGPEAFESVMRQLRPEV